MIRQSKTVVWLLIASVVLLVWSLWFASSQVIGPIEQNIFFAINGLPNILRLPFIVITYTGSIYFLGALTLFLIWRRQNRLALRIFMGGAAAFFLTQGMKVIVERPRPVIILNDVIIRERLITGYGFPSTHTAVVTVMALLLMLALPKKWRWWLVAWIGLVGLSRVYLGVHAPLDIVGGFAAGSLIVCIAMLIQGKLAFVRNITGLKLSD